MFIDANDEKWNIQKLQEISQVQPLSVCFMDEYGNSFLKRVKECLGKPVLMSLSIPFECYIEGNGKEHIKKRGFLVVNDFMGMMYGYGLLGKLKSDFIPLLTKKDIHVLRKKGILCFLDYGTVYIEYTRNIWLEKEWMGKGLTSSFFRSFCKSPKRFLYDFRNRRPKFITADGKIEKEVKQSENNYHYKIEDAIKNFKQSSISFVLEGKIGDFGCKVTIKKEDLKKAFESLNKIGFVKKIDNKTEDEVWVLDKVPVLVEEGKIYLEKWQCEWFYIPYLEIIKAP